jgi:hypothetical protein
VRSFGAEWRAADRHVWRVRWLVSASTPGTFGDHNRLRGARTVLSQSSEATLLVRNM